MRGAAAIAVALVVAGCGKEVPAGGVRAPTTVAAATDLIPEDLDLVVRVDLARMRTSLGEEATGELLTRAAAEDSPFATPQPLLKRALADAEVVWLGLRVADAEVGDRVIVVRPRPHRDAEQDAAVDWRELPAGWERSATDIPEVARLSVALPPRRDGTERIYLVGREPTAVFVSPVETMSIERVLRRGPDPRRGQPEARGVVSLDYRAGRLGETWATRFPSLAALWRGVERIVALVDVRGDTLQLDARIRCKRPGDATRLLRFVDTIRKASLEGETYRALLEPLTIEQNEHTINLSWSLPAKAIAAILVGTSGEHGNSVPPSPVPPTE